MGVAMDEGQVDRRRGRRISLHAPLTIRRVSGQQAETFKETVIGNVSLAGVYFETGEKDAYAIDDVVMTSVTIPESQRRDFPFTRLAGRSRVVRVRELPADKSGGKRYGVALQFGEDLTALTTIPLLR